MTVAEAADTLGVSTQTIYNYINDGILPAQRPGNRYTLRARDVTNLAKKRERAAGRQSR
jgi:excisionase family DNA binding protein